MSDDNRTIVHHKVAARAYCVFGPEDAQFSAREMPYEKRPAAAPTSSGGKPPALSFDHVLQRLQAELAKSKETGADLQGLTSAMTDIQDTLGGGLVGDLPLSNADGSPPPRTAAQPITFLPSIGQPNLHSMGLTVSRPPLSSRYRTSSPIPKPHSTSIWRKFVSWKSNWKSTA